MKVRVPKELRPPSRFGAFRCPRLPQRGEYRVAGVYRNPREGEFFWSMYGEIEVARLNFKHSPRVILERVK